MQQRNTRDVGREKGVEGGNPFIYALGEISTVSATSLRCVYHEFAPLLPANEDRLDSSNDCLGF
jgi:hypothetical protein